MHKRIIVLNRVDAEEYIEESRWACISITTDADDQARIRRPRRVGLLRLAFADMTQPQPGFILFGDDHAHDILDFVTHTWRRIRTLMIHCHAGRSRSAAVAAAIARLKGSRTREFLEPPYCPNPRVYRTLLEVASGREDYQRITASGSSGQACLG